MSAEATDPRVDYDQQLRDLCVTGYYMTPTEASIAEALHAACWCQSEHDLYAEEGMRPYGGCGPWVERDAVRGLMAAARPVYYREAADSLDAHARARLETAPDAVAYARAEGIAEAARLLRSTAKDEGNTDA